MDETPSTRVPPTAPCSEATLVRVKVPRNTSFKDMATNNDSTFHQAMEHEIPLSLLHEVLEHGSTQREQLSWAVLSIGQPSEATPRRIHPFDSGTFTDASSKSSNADRLPLHSHSIMEIAIDESGELTGRWRCKAALMNQRELDDLATRFCRILQAVSQSTREGPSLQDTIEMRVIQDETIKSSARLFGSRQRRSGKQTDLSRPALQGDGSPKRSRGQDYNALPVGSRMLFGSVDALPPEAQKTPPPPPKVSEGDD